MMYSMTGFGSATFLSKDKSIIVDLKTLNGKTSDIRLRIPNNYKEKEVIIRNLVMNQLKRGKIDLQFRIESLEGDTEYALNEPLFKVYYDQLMKIQRELNIESGDIIQSILRIPNVIKEEYSEINDSEWESVKDTLLKAMEKLMNFRQTEGASLKSLLETYTTNIEDLLKEVDPFEEKRIEKLKTRLKVNLAQYVQNEQIDQNRFEQELIYYIEKLDISEEKNRLAQHCSYFKEIMRDDNIEKGKKLSFISQEIGREINTLGAKAQNSDMQKIVVRMKDNLEKMKEQLSNVL